MVTLLSLLLFFLTALLARGFPVATKLAARGPFYSHDQRARWGSPVRSDVTRFVVKYANAQRWKPSTVVSILQGTSLLQQVYILFLPRLLPSMNRGYRTSLLLAPSLA